MLKGLNEQRAMQGKSEIRVGIGIAVGKVIAGYTCTQHRASCACVGDIVNLAARIQNHTKVTGTLIITDQYTREGLSNQISVQDLGEVIFKGKQQALRVFTVNPQG